MSGFKKSGVFPFNPGVVTDRQVAPSKVLRQKTPEIGIRTWIQKNLPQIPVSHSSHLKRKHCIGNDTKNTMIFMTLVMSHG